MNRFELGERIVKTFGGAAKLVAAMDRQHPRDLFDVQLMYDRFGLRPDFVECFIVYLAAHNHASDQEVGFSRIDLQSHERGYPALLQIARGMPVGARPAVRS